MGAVGTVRYQVKDYAAIVAKVLVLTASYWLAGLVAKDLPTSSVAWNGALFSLALGFTWGWVDKASKRSISFGFGPIAVSGSVLGMTIVADFVGPDSEGWRFGTIFLCVCTAVVGVSAFCLANRDWRYMINYMPGADLEDEEPE